MRNIALMLLSLLCIVGMTACSNSLQEKSDNNLVVPLDIPGNQMDIRKVVWEQLTPEDRKLIEGSWKEAKVSKVTLRSDMMLLVPDKSYEGKEVYLIDYPTIGKSVPNDLAVYADIKTCDYIGLGLVD